jgi:hypothetical protein
MAKAINPTISLRDVPDFIRNSFRCAGVHPETVRYTQLLETVGYERAKEVPDFRRFLQKLGTEGVRDIFGEDAWVEALENRLVRNGLMEPANEDNYAGVHGDARVVITDVRFPNEAKWIHRCHGTLWRVVRPGYGGNDLHPSEAHIAGLPADVELIAATLDDLRYVVMAQMELELS